MAMDSKMEQDYPNEEELELGLGLSLNCGAYGKTAGFCASGGTNVSGTKRAADFLAPTEHSASKVGSQIIGWPPIRTYRMNNLVNQAKSANNERVGENDKIKITLENTGHRSNKNDNAVKERGHFGFVKVNMDGMQIGRKVDLSAHTSYEILAQTLEEMFLRPATTINSICGEKQIPTQHSKLLDGSSEFVLTYEDKEGDWMLVGDVPWRMFLNTVKRLRIMKTSEASGLAPRFQERKERKKNNRPI